MKITTDIVIGAVVVVAGWLGYRRYESVKVGDTVMVALQVSGLTYNVKMTVKSLDGSGNFTGTPVDLGGLPTSYTQLLAASIPLSQITQNLTPKLF